MHNKRTGLFSNLLPFTFYLLPFTFFLPSCNLVNPPVIIPAYGHIDKITFSCNYNLYGSDSSKITDVWVYVDDNPVGAFQMPCTFPIIATNGIHSVTVYAGIMVDGVASMRAKYPFYYPYTANFTLTQGKTVNMDPIKVTYASWTKVHWDEEFPKTEGLISIQKVPSISDTDIFIETSDVFQGTGSGEVCLDNKHGKYTGTSDSAFVLPRDGATSIYLEMNYKCPSIFTVGLYAGTIATPIPIVYIYPSANWNKMYINLQPTVLTNPATGYYVYFSMAFDSTQGHTARFYLDNIKLLY